MPTIAALETVPIVAALIGALIAFGAWVCAMIRIDPVADTLARETDNATTSEAHAGEREWLKVPAVRPGGLCRVPGAIGSTATGIAMICTPERDGIARWRWCQPGTRSA